MLWDEESSQREWVGAEVEIRRCRIWEGVSEGDGVGVIGWYECVWGAEKEGGAGEEERDAEWWVGREGGWGG